MQFDQKSWAGKNYHRSLNERYGRIRRKFNSISILEYMPEDFLGYDIELVRQDIFWAGLKGFKDTKNLESGEIRIKSDIHNKNITIKGRTIDVLLNQKGVLIYENPEFDTLDNELKKYMEIKKQPRTLKNYLENTYLPYARKTYNILKDNCSSSGQLTLEKIFKFAMKDTRELMESN